LQPASTTITVQIGTGTMRAGTIGLKTGLDQAKNPGLIANLVQLCGQAFALMMV
jgi:hypothetical protein